MKRIGVISDTHLAMHDDSLEELAARHFRDVDFIVHAGDLVTLDVIETLAILEHPVIAVCGNMDAPEVRSSYPVSRTITVEEVTIGIIHGWGSPNGIRQRIRSSFTGVDAIIYGHSHQPFSGMESGIFFFNPGSPNDSRFTSGRSVGIMEIQGKAITGAIIKV
jgi:putative phosphoesterase